MLAVVLIVGVGAAAAAFGLAGPAHKPTAKSVFAYHRGKIPAWIPDTKAPANPAPVTASLVTPASTLVEGDVVHAIFPRGMAMVTVTGPSEPAWVERAIQSGHSKWGQQSPGTFYVSYAQVQGTVPVAATGFVVKMPEGNFRPTRISVQGGGQVPALLHAGQRLTLLMHFSLLPAGEGALVWTPSRDRLLAGWDFDFELT